jgi:hypothetical protein
LFSMSVKLPGPLFFFFFLMNFVFCDNYYSTGVLCTRFTLVTTMESKQSHIKWILWSLKNHEGSPLPSTNSKWIVELKILDNLVILIILLNIWDFFFFWKCETEALKIFIIITGYNFNIYVTIEDYEKVFFN